MLKRILRKAKTILIPPEIQRKKRLRKYKKSGSIPWSPGYGEYKEEQIKIAIHNDILLKEILHKALPQNYGVGIDDRIVEYPWLFSNISKHKGSVLDAGSTFNFKYLVEHPVIQNKDLTIYTYYPESPNFNEKRISYVYGDLRELPFKENYFDEVICQSTLEHIDMDNSMYGYDINHKSDKAKSYEYLKVIKELIRVIKQKGIGLITFPYGKFENHNFFQQFDNEMLARMLDEFSGHGTFETTFFKYFSTGWMIVKKEDCEDATSFNPHTGIGKGNDGAAHSRSICCIKFLKK
jgi:SAM-dependent methyltransferase